MDLRFVKVEGLGNDFLLVDRRDSAYAEAEAELAALATAAPSLCNRRTGVGADGILVVGPGPDPDHDATMWVINHDGSRPEMCGNGLRCVAWVVAASTGRDQQRIATDAGSKLCEVDRSAGWVLVDMGPGVDHGTCTPAGQGRSFANVSMGNPHAIAFVASGENAKQLAHEDGPAIERAPEFPARTNVEFARLAADGSIELWVWERGCGITQACGTGACATVCAAVWGGHREPDVPVAVDLPGGRLEITVPSDRTGGVQMRGPARVAFRGTVELNRPRATR